MIGFLMKDGTLVEFSVVSLNNLSHAEAQKRVCALLRMVPASLYETKPGVDDFEGSRCALMQSSDVTQLQPETAVNQEK